MSNTISKKETIFLNKILKKSININNIYKYEGYILGMLCGEDVVPPSQFIADMFGSDIEWKNEEEVRLFLELYTKINNKSVTKLASNIYRPIFAKTKEELSQYAFGFLNSFRNSSLTSNEYLGIAYATVNIIYKVDQELLDTDEKYIEFSKLVLEKPIQSLSLAVKDMNDIRLHGYVDESYLSKSNIINFDNMSDTFH
ncbi:UPF0149 family protein [Francisella sp. TX07-6608]|uniref:UPF0149 family protein n=1 Tax=Francisella sp. TX07-6608 TaxID=573568 RepID=UPI0008F9ABA7|nr:UPF0149 family protein [Francisella sp. TX07-6608]OIN85093.1 hypothetical protein KX00_2168 [Francisella sp. TX07-6608]